MSPFGQMVFSALADCNRRIADGVQIADAAETLDVELTASIAEYAVTERAYSGGRLLEGGAE